LDAPPDESRLYASAPAQVIPRKITVFFSLAESSIIDLIKYRNNIYYVFVDPSLYLYRNYFAEIVYGQSRPRLYSFGVIAMYEKCSGIENRLVPSNLR
jgi:hypothetical protein